LSVVICAVKAAGAVGAPPTMASHDEQEYLDHDHRTELIEQGYTIFPGAVSPELVAELSLAINERVASMPHNLTPDGQEQSRHKGDHLHLVFNEKVNVNPMGGAGIAHPSMVRLVCNPKSLRALDRVGCEDKKFWSGYVLSKPAGGPPLYWHNDWQYWDDPVSCDPMPTMMFGMIYLVDTSVHNGCLRIVPRSHRRDGEVWDVIKGNNHLSNEKPADVDPASVIAAGGMEDAAPTPFADEIFTAPGRDVPMKAGDLLLGDSRLLHGTHPNDSDGRRTCITLWYLSRFESLPERIRVGFANEWAGSDGAAILPGIDDAGLLEREKLIPRCASALGRSFPARSNPEHNGHSVYPTGGAQDFLGANLPEGYWVEQREESARL
jgi:hypothetical protein